MTKHEVVGDPHGSERDQNGREEARHLLLKAWSVVGAAAAANHLWWWETDRWKEFAFALLAQAGRATHDNVRDLADQLSELGLLQVPMLVRMCRDRRPDFNTADARRFLNVAEEHGFTRTDAERGLFTLCEAALKVQEHFRGKVQRMLRGYGELMLHELKQFFAFSQITEGQATLALAYWLQNVLGMPLSLLDENLHVFAHHHNLTPEDILEAADDLDLNLALVDDLLHYYVARASAESAAGSQRAVADHPSGG